MRRSRSIAVAAATAPALWLSSHLALAQKSGGVLKMPDFASPASMSIHEEVTRAAVTVLMPVFNNPVLFDQLKDEEHARHDHTRPRRKLDLERGRQGADGLEFPIVASVATRNLMFIADNADMTLSYGVSMPLLRDIKSQVSEAICTITTDNGARNLIINPANPPFDNAESRRAVTLTLDHKAFVDILVEGQGLIGGVMQPPPGGIWGLPVDKLAELPGYDSDVAKNRAGALVIMEKLGNGPNNRLGAPCRPATPPATATRPSSRSTR